MTMHPPPDPDDLASDLVDGLLPPDEAARLRADPAVAARVEAIESMRAALRVAPPSPPGAMDSAVGAALAALDAPSGAPSGERPTLTAVPTPPGMGYPSGPRAPTRPTRGSKSSSGTTPWLAAAAAIVLLGLITIGVLSQGGSNDQDSAASGASDEATPEEQMSADADAGADSNDDASQPPGAAVPDSTTAPRSPGDGETGSGGEPSVTTSSEADGQLGSVTNTNELAQRIASSGRQPSRTEASSQTDGELGDVNATFDERTCSGLSEEGDPGRGRAMLVGDATFQGNPVRVHVYENTDGSQQLVATDRSCTDVVDTPYEP